MSKTEWHKRILMNAIAKILDANQRRANALINDCTVRIDYEETLGAALDNARLVLEKVMAGEDKPQ